MVTTGYRTRSYNMYYVNFGVFHGDLVSNSAYYQKGVSLCGMITGGGLDCKKGVSGSYIYMSSYGEGVVV